LSGVIARRIFVVISLLFSGVDALLLGLSSGGPVLGDCFDPLCRDPDYIRKFSESRSIEAVSAVIVVVCLGYLWNGSRIAAVALLGALAFGSVLAGRVDQSVVAGGLILQAPAVVLATAVLLDSIAKRRKAEPTAEAR